MKDQAVDHLGNPQALSSGSYFHLTDVAASWVMHNARLGHGFLSSVSLLAQVPGWEGMTTPYAVLNGHPDKEAAWEAVRAAEFGYLPSRFKSFYCFESEPDAERARLEWFGAQPKRQLRLRIVEGSGVARVDANWLNCHPESWEGNARSYWSGAMTDQPFVEVIVTGRVYFPDWETFPLLGS